MPDLIPLTKSEIRIELDRLAISADAKAVLDDIAAVTANVGGKIIVIGRQILHFLLDLFNQFPNTAFGAIAAFVVASLVASVPLVGALLSTFLSPLLLAFGIAGGAIADIQNSAIKSRIAQFENQLQTITAAK